MYRIGDYILVKSIEEFNGDFMKRCDDDSVVTCSGIFCDVNKVTYPHVFKRHNNFDTACIDEYRPCSKDEMVRAVQKKIERWMSDIASCETLLKVLDDVE